MFAQMIVGDLNTKAWLIQITDQVVLPAFPLELLFLILGVVIILVIIVAIIVLIRRHRKS